ncbi:MAG: TOBE domain-containing protein, partial [Candidatus Nanopelagicales bacterium]
GVAAIGGVDVPNIGLLPGKEAVPAVSGAAYLMVRPEDIQIVEGDGLLTGTVLETQFFGGASTIAVLVPGHEVPVVLTCHGSASVSRGAIAHLAWPAEKAVVLNR